MIRSGTGSIKRRNGTNYNTKGAQARLDEVIKPSQAKGLNALKVDSFAVQYYYQGRSTEICTCKQTTLLPQHQSISSTLPPTVVNQQSLGDTEIVIDYNRPLFGHHADVPPAEDDDFELLDNGDEDAPPDVVSALLESSADCGICYRTGFIPGYQQYGAERQVYATQHTDDTYGYTLDVTATPHVFNKTDVREGFVEFVLRVPRFFRSVSLSVRDNTSVLEDSVFLIDGTPVSFTNFKYAAGKQLAVRVTSEAFTHLVVVYDLGTDPVLANLAQMSKTLDWTQFTTIGNLQIVLPMTIPEVQSSDVIHLPARSLTLKVTDVTYLRTAKDSNIDWSVGTRVLQPQESLKYIHKCTKLVAF